MFNEEERKLLLEILTVEQSKHMLKKNNDIADKLEVLRKKIVMLSSAGTVRVNFN